MTFGPSGTYLNAGIPVLGIYNRQKLTGGGALPSPTLPKQPTVFMEEPRSNIFSADIHEITSQDMQGVKEAILLARQQRLSLINDLSQIESALKKTKLKKTMSYLLLNGLLKKSIPENLSEDILAQDEAIKQTKEQIEESFVKFDVHFDPEIQQKYNAMVAAFHDLAKSHKIWDVTSANYQDRVMTRSSASEVVTRRNVRFTVKSIPEFKSEVQALYFQNANGADLYIYPSFIVMAYPIHLILPLLVWMKLIFANVMCDSRKRGQFQQIRK